MGRVPAALYVTRRREILKMCNGLAKKPLEFDASLFTEDPEARNTFGRSIYKDLGNFAYEHFIESLEASMRGRLEKTGTKDGFDVMALLIGASPEPYRKFQVGKGKPVTVSGLQAALKRSISVPALFMRQHGNVNHVVEFDFGLNRNSGEADTDKFHFEDTDEGEIFIIDEEQFETSLVNARRNPPSDPEAWAALPETLRQCPAMGFVIEQAWPAMVDLAGEVPGTLEHDLGLRESNPNAA